MKLSLAPRATTLQFISMNSAPRIVVVGSANTDLTTFIDQFPRPGETIFGRDFHLGFGGKGANQAVAARRCGAVVSMVARVGDDLFGPATSTNFLKYGIDATFVSTTAGVSSGVAPIFVETSGQNRILVVKGANDLLTAKDVDAAADVLRLADVVITQLEIPIETVYYTLRMAKGFGAITILNPAPGRELDFEQLSYADYVIPNETEAEALTGMPTRSVEECQDCARHLIEKGIQRAIITLGANGALLAAEGELRHVPGCPIQAIDTTGAGDAFIGSFAYFLGNGISMLQAIERANLYAALSTLSRGTQASFVTREQFDKEWAKRTGA